MFCRALDGEDKEDFVVRSCRTTEFSLSSRPEKQKDCFETGELVHWLDLVLKIKGGFGFFVIRLRKFDAGHDSAAFRPACYI